MASQSSSALYSPLLVGFSVIAYILICHQIPDAPSANDGHSSEPQNLRLPKADGTIVWIAVLAIDIITS